MTIPVPFNQHHLTPTPLPVTKVIAVSTVVRNRKPAPDDSLLRPLAATRSVSAPLDAKYLPEYVVEVRVTQDKKFL